MIDLTQAACVEWPSDWWFAERGPERDAALAICQGCPIRAACLDHALELEGTTARQGRSGIFGGLTPAQRARLPRAPVPAREPCGTASAARAHGRRGEPIDAACAVAVRVYRRDLAAKARAAA